jgi:hypothetical protein
MTFDYLWSCFDFTAAPSGGFSAGRGRLFISNIFLIGIETGREKTKRDGT